MKYLIYSLFKGRVSLKNKMGNTVKQRSTSVILHQLYALGKLSVPKESPLLSSFNITVDATDILYYRQKVARVDQWF